MGNEDDYEKRARKFAHDRSAQVADAEEAKGLRDLTEPPKPLTAIVKDVEMLHSLEVFVLKKYAHANELGTEWKPDEFERQRIIRRVRAFKNIAHAGGYILEIPTGDYGDGDFVYLPAPIEITRLPN